MTVDSLSGFPWTPDTYPHALLYFLLVISFYPYLSSTLLYITLATGYEDHFHPRCRRLFGSNRVSWSQVIYSPLSCLIGLSEAT